MSRPDDDTRIRQWLQVQEAVATLAQQTAALQRDLAQVQATLETLLAGMQGLLRSLKPPAGP
jgi:uncharacterized protein involved in exopolysaccharide biosynthesis